jgi:hypothetical protein
MVGIIITRIHEKINLLPVNDVVWVVYLSNHVETIQIEVRVTTLVRIDSKKPSHWIEGSR